MDMADTVWYKTHTMNSRYIKTMTVIIVLYF